jgi:hypothetical protein
MLKRMQPNAYPFIPILAAWLIFTEQFSVLKIASTCCSTSPSANSFKRPSYQVGLSSRVKWFWVIDISSSKFPLQVSMPHFIICNILNAMTL